MVRGWGGMREVPCSVPGNMRKENKKRRLSTLTYIIFGPCCEDKSSVPSEVVYFQNLWAAICYLGKWLSQNM